MDLTPNRRDRDLRVAGQPVPAHLAAELVDRKAAMSIGLETDHALAIDGDGQDQAFAAAI